MKYANKIVQKLKKTAIFADKSLYVRYITAADAFPATIVQEEDIVAIDAGDFVAVLVHGVPPFALLDTETAVSEHCRKLVGISIHSATRTMVYIPV